MKRILSLVLILILSVAALTACEFPFPWGDDPSYDLDNAKGALVELYPKLAPTKENPVPNTVSNYDLTKVLPLKDGTYTVAWTTSNENVAIKDYVPADEKDVLSAENTVTVHVPQRPEIGEPDITYTLSALITAPNGTTAKIDFNLKVPAMAINTYDEYVNAKVGDFLTVEGIVNGINSKADGNKDDSVYFQDENGGYYAYQVNADVLATLEIGMKIRVSGERGDYSGTHELLNATIEIIDETPVPVTPLDYTDIILGAENLKVDELVYKQAVLVTIKGVTIAEPGDNGYYHFTIGGHKVYLRVSSSNNACSTADTAALIALHAANFGNKADVTGLVCLYNGAFYLMPTSADAFHNFVAPERTPAEKVEFESENLKVTDKVTENSTIALPLTGTVISDVVISWTIDNENFTIGEDGKLPIVLGNEEVTLKLTATFTCGEATATKDYEIKVAAASKMPYVHKPLSAPVVGTFKIAMNTTPANGKVLYFNGQLNDKGALMTTDRFEEAVDVIVEVLDAEAGTYSLKVGDKYLEGYLNGTYKNIRFADEPKAWKWNSDAKVFVCEIDGVSYYFGDRDRGGYANTTMALSDIKYITGDNLSKVGVSQFPGFLGTMAPAAYTSAPITTPGAGSFIIVMDTTPANGKPLYFNGELNSKGALMTTDKIENAVEVIVEVLDAEAGTYSLKVGDKYLEGYLNGTYKNIRFADEPKAWKWNSDAKVFVCDIDGIDYYFGDRDRGGYANDTMALSDIKYITGDNLSKIGVSQFTGAFSTVVTKEVAASPITTPGAGSFIIVMDTTPANGKPLYFNGELNSKGALMTTDKIENAVEVIVEVLDAEAGTYSLKAGDKYLEGYLNGTYKNIRFADEPKAWKWNADAKVFVCDIDGIDYYFGDRDRGGYANDTMALSDIKYITGDNLSKIGVSQFTGAFSTIEFVTEDGGETPEQPGEGGGETPDQPGEGGNQGGETPSAPTTAEEILNALYALSDGETLAGSFTLTGKITTLDSWKNPTIVIEGFDSKPVYCYKLKDDRFVVGATITVTATTLKNYQGTYELEGCTLVEITLPEGSDDNTDDDNTGSDVTTGNAYEYTFVSGVFTKDGTVALGSKNWTLTTVTSSGDAAYFGFDSQNGKGFQFGKAKDHLTSMTLVSESFTNVTKIVINTSGAKDVNGSFEVYVGDVKVGDSTTLTSSATDYTFECSTALTGEVKIVYTNSAKAIYIKSIQVVTAE